MAGSVDVPVSAVPVALEDALGALEVGKRLTASNDSENVIFWRISVAAPASDANGHPLPPYRDITVVFAAGAEKTWVWTRGEPAALVVTEEGG